MVKSNTISPIIGCDKRIPFTDVKIHTLKLHNQYFLYEPLIKGQVK